MFVAVSIAYQSIVYLLPFLLWPSRRNIQAIVSLPIFLIAHVIGTAIFEVQAKEFFGVTQASIDEYTLILLVSCIVVLPTYLAGFYFKSDAVYFIRKLALAFWPRLSGLLVGKMPLVLSLIAAALFTYAYIKIGFAPLLTEKPEVARFFADEYEEPYRPYAGFFRLALLLSQISIFILAVRILNRIRILDVLLVLLLVFLLALSARRALIFSSLLLVILGYFCFRKQQFFWPVVIAYSLFVGVGSSIFTLTALLLSTGGNPGSFFSILVNGLPDVRDSLWFIHSWLSGRWPATDGLSIIGGLLPEQFPYNPSIISKLVIGSRANAATGGFRFDIPTLGFMAFSWPGVVLFSAIYGYFSGVLLQTYKSILSQVENLSDFLIWTFIFKQIFGLPYFIFNMQIDFLVNLMLVFFIFLSTRIKAKV
jgi:hypothetical protein